MYIITLVVVENLLSPYTMTKGIFILVVVDTMSICLLGLSHTQLVAQNSRHLFTGSGGQKPEIKAPAGLVPCGAPAGESVQASPSFLWLPEVLGVP